VEEIGVFLFEDVFGRFDTKDEALSWYSPEAFSNSNSTIRSTMYKK